MVVLFAMMATLARADQSGSIVKLSATAAGHHALTRNGEPFFIRGVGGNGSLELLARMGGNSVRTWGADNLPVLLDEAHKHGLTVTVGIWLGHERHGFDYNNADQVARQYATAREIILKFKDHPAVLLWGIGNEMEGYGEGDNAAIWSAVNNIASLAHQLDPHHPTMTVVAEIGGDRVKNIHRLCPDIDIVGINSYGGLSTLPDRYKKAGGVKPYVVTEFGPPGMWEVPKNAWGVPAELSSTAKAGAYRTGYKDGILAAEGACLGGYAFLWGQKQEATATWFGMLLPDGSRLAAADAMQELWTGKPPANRCPQITSLKIVPAQPGGATDQFDPGATIHATLDASDLEGDALQVKWLLRGEPENYSTGGDDESAPPTFPEAVIAGSLTKAQIRLPSNGGGYRLFATVNDPHGGAAVVNVPLLVKGPVVLPPARQAKLPVVIYDEGDPAKAAFVPTGWMGNHKALRLDPLFADRTHSGKTCLRVGYQAADNWAGVVWQSPAGDWGDRAGGWNLTGAKTLSFWTRGSAGGEILTFEFGLIGKDKKFSDSSRGKLDKVTLTSDWKQYTIDLGSQDLTRIKTGFAFVLAGQGRPIEFFLDDVRFE